MFRSLPEDAVEQLATLQQQIASKEERIDGLEDYIANVMQKGVQNSTVLRELHDALAAKDATIAELQDYIDAQAAAQVQKQDDDKVSIPSLACLLLKAEVSAGFA